MARACKPSDIDHVSAYKNNKITILTGQDATYFNSLLQTKHSAHWTNALSHIHP